MNVLLGNFLSDFLVDFDFSILLNCHPAPTRRLGAPLGHLRLRHRLRPLILLLFLNVVVFGRLELEVFLSQRTRLLLQSDILFKKHVRVCNPIIHRGFSA